MIFLKKLNELNEIFDVKDLKFNDDYYEECFELLGRNIKYYNILSDYYNNQNQEQKEENKEEEEQKEKKEKKEQEKIEQKKEEEGKEEEGKEEQKEEEEKEKKFQKEEEEGKEEKGEKSEKEKGEKKEKEKENNIEKYMKEEKQRIKDKIREFYDYKSNMKNIIKLLYFSTTTKYNLDSFINIAEFVPFKYFNPIVEYDKDYKQYIIIKYAFPLIEEIRNELLDEIIYFEFNIYETLCENRLVDGGARGEMFEKFVTFQLNPTVRNDRRKIFFKDIEINDVISMKSFIPKTNENIIKRKKKKKKKLAKGTYLFTQKIINGKALDILIVKMFEDYLAIVYAFQITIHKPNDEMFTKKKLSKCMELLKDNLENIYNMKIDYYSFAYIFDRSYKKPLLKNMIEKCIQENISYMTFDPINIEFYDKMERKAEYLDACTEHPSKKRTIMFDVFKELTIPFWKLNLFEKVNLKRGIYFIMPFEKQIAINILRKYMDDGDKIKDLKFLKTINNITEKDFCKDKIYIGKSLPNSYLFMVYYSKLKNKYVHEFLTDSKKENFNESDARYNYDEYEIIKD